MHYASSHVTAAHNLPPPVALGHDCGANCKHWCGASGALHIVFLCEGVFELPGRRFHGVCRARASALGRCRIRACLLVLLWSCIESREEQIPLRAHRFCGDRTAICHCSDLACRLTSRSAGTSHIRSRLAAIAACPAVPTLGRTRNHSRITPAIKTSSVNL
jgi:hypothetical protein